MSARITEGEPNTLREGPDSGSRRITSIPGLSPILVLDGPQCATLRNGLPTAWWYVGYQEFKGWTPEGQGGTYWIEPLQASQPLPPVVVVTDPPPAVSAPPCLELIYAHEKRINSTVGDAFGARQGAPYLSDVQCYQRYTYGLIYWPGKGQPYAMYGDIFVKWLRLGGEKGLGWPFTDELSMSDGVGRYNNFDLGSIYWHPKTGAWSIRQGPIWAKYAELGRERSCLGYPISDPGNEVLDGVSYTAVRFEGGIIYTDDTTFQTVFDCRK
jgi:hypothetical protein